jgi:regulator of sirC expression with transglutaminase-like and TPR domain
MWGKFPPTYKNAYIKLYDLHIPGVLWFNANGMADNFSKDTSQQRIYRAFVALLAGDDHTIDLAQAALLIASIEYPELDAARYIAQLDTFAERVRGHLALPDPQQLPQLPAETDTLAVIDAINTVLFEEEQFRGNKEDYYNPNNSFLNKVLEDRVGIPISLSLVYTEVGRRVGLQIDGIGFPYHFMLRCRLPQGMIYIDPYEGGLRLSEQGCQERLRQLTPHKIRPHSHWFEPFSHRRWLIRILNNLKKIYIQRDHFERALIVCDLMILLSPRAALERRDRGLILLQQKRYSRSIRDLTAYTELAPDADDREEILNYIKMARQTLAMLN